MTGEELREIRERLGWTQREFAEQLGLHPNTLAKQERGEARIRVAIERLARVLDGMHRPLPRRRKS